MEISLIHPTWLLQSQIPSTESKTLQSMQQPPRGFQGRGRSLERMRYTSFNKGLKVKLQKKKKVHFVSARLQHWVITEWNDLRIRFPSLESYWGATGCGGTFTAAHPRESPCSGISSGSSRFVVIGIADAPGASSVPETGVPTSNCVDVACYWLTTASFSGDSLVG